MSLRTLTFTIFLLLWAALGTALAVVPPYTSLALGWDKHASHDTNISYVLKWGNTNGSAQFSTNVGHKFTAIVTNPTPGILYFHVVAVTPDGIESLPSNVVVETNHPAAPLRLILDRTNATTSSIRIEGTTDGAATWIHLATVTSENAPAIIQSATKQLLIRSKLVVPPLP